MKRLSVESTMRIQPEQKISISYGGKSYGGFVGDTIAALLYANGVRVFSRSLKYHRPRGLYSLDGECSNTMMQVDGEPNVRAENTLAEPGMVVKAQNISRGKTADRDAMAFMDKMSFAMPAGFYYRTMHKPAKAWPKAIPKIRKAAGLGILDPEFEIAGVFDEIYPTSDVCVIGGGPAGMRAALAAAEQGLRVILIEKRPWLGGHFEYRMVTTEAGTPLYQRARELAAKVLENPNIRVFDHTFLVGNYNNNLVTAFQKGGGDEVFTQRYVEIRTQSLVVTTGCIERPLLFEHNERPGVMQVACAHRLARTWGILPGENALFSIGDDLGLEAAVDLYDLGMNVAGVADIREDGQNDLLVDALSTRGISLYRGWLAMSTKGTKAVTEATIAPITGKPAKTVECDLLVASAGLTPVTGPLTICRARQQFDPRTGFFLPTHIPGKVHAAGRIWGLQDSAAIEASGVEAGLLAAKDCGCDVDSLLEEAAALCDSLPGRARGAKLVAAAVSGKKTFICFDEDTTLRNIDQAMAMGFDVPELIKRFTSAGTGPGQGGIPGHNLPLYVAQTCLSPDEAPRPTNVRAPLTPVLMATYAGSSHVMSKLTPLHAGQVTAGGRMERIGVWMRARRFSDDVSAANEVETVRTKVGMLDASTLGKFRLYGPDAEKALQRVYAGDMTRFTEGRIKYAAMCNEDGCVIDDGVVVKEGENDYYLTTSTGRAGETVAWLRYHTRFDGWDYHLVNLTDAMGVINLAGPSARKVLTKVTDTDVSNEAFGFSEVRAIEIKGIPVKAMRLGFVGELSYEFHVPSSYTQAMWNILEAAGKEFGITPFGLEAQNIMRMEKGHLIIGSESEQRTNLLDLGMGFLWDRHKTDARTVGHAALTQAENQTGRLKLVGIMTTDASADVPKDGSPIIDTRVRGWLCTARYSTTQKRPVGMALVEDSLAVEGTELGIYEPGCKGKLISVKVAKMPFYDTTGGRMKS